MQEIYIYMVYTMYMHHHDGIYRKYSDGFQTRMACREAHASGHCCATVTAPCWAISGRVVLSRGFGPAVERAAALAT